MNQILEKIKLKLPYIFSILVKTIPKYTEKFEKTNLTFEIITEERMNRLKSMFSDVDESQKYTTPRIEHTIDGVTSWDTFTLFRKKIYKVGNTKAQIRAFQDELITMDSQISNLFSGIALELSDYYKNNGLPEKIAIEIDIATRETTISEHFGERVVEHKFVLPPFEPETTTEPKNSKNQS